MSDHIQMRRGAVVLGLVAGLAAAAPTFAVKASAAPAAQDAATAVDPTHDGSHDFDFLIGDWKAHVRRLPDRLVGSNTWIDYDGISNHRKLLDSNANFEQFEVWGTTDKTQHIKAQTLRLYNPKSHQWSIYLVDLDNGTLGLPATVGQFTGKRGAFFDTEDWKGRSVLVRFLWLDQGPHAARMEQAFSPDGGKTWETNWICALSR
ncbi:MAG TPA: hypothetical protein VMD53_14410 [Rhizomicrobium sp.]|nr:hypothetical protein [Rhizomicrobium sp.]